MADTKKLSLSEYTTRKAATASVGNVPTLDDPRDDSAAPETHIESTSVDYDEDKKLVVDKPVDPQDNIKQDTSLEMGEVKDDRVGAQPASNTGENAPFDYGSVITNRTDDDELVDGIRSEIFQSPEYLPWRLRPETYNAWMHHRSATFPVALFDCSSLRDNEESSTTRDRTRYFTDLFLRLRYTERRRRPPTAETLTQAWNAFVLNWNQGPAAWLDRLVRIEERNTLWSVNWCAIGVHRLSREAGVPCCVGDEISCPMCHVTSYRLSRDEMNDSTHLWANYIPQRIRLLCDTLDRLIERENNWRGRSTTRDSTRNRSQDRERPRANSREAPRYLTREGTLASEHGSDGYASDQGFDPGDQQSFERANDVGPTNPPTAPVAAETVPVPQELRVLQDQLAVAMQQIATLSTTVATQSTKMTDRLELIAQLQAENMRLANAQTALRADLNAQVAVHSEVVDLRARLESLLQQHSRLEGDHKRVLGILRLHKMDPPPLKRHRGGDKDGDAQHKT